MKGKIEGEDETMENKGISLKSVTAPLKWLESEWDKKGWGKAKAKAKVKEKGVNKKINC